MSYVERIEPEVLHKAIERYGKTNQTVVAMEELSELQKELSKALRGYANRKHITEEVADVLIMLNQIILMYDIDASELARGIRNKIERLKRRMEDIS